VLYTLHVAKGRLFHDHLVTIARANRKHANGNIFACYGSWIGEGVVTLLYPMNSPDKLPSSTLQEDILIDVYGADEAKKLISDFANTLCGEEHTVLHYLPEFSNLPDLPDQTPYEFIYHVSVERSAFSKTAEFEALLSSTIEANRNYKSGLRWIVYGERGAALDRCHVYVPFRKMAILDEWVDVLLNKRISITEGESFTQTLRCGVNDYRTYIHVHVADCDHSGTTQSEGGSTRDDQ
jgi:hypothetical protein